MAENLPAERGEGIARFGWENLPALRSFAGAISAGLADDDYIAWQYEENPLATPELRALFLHLRSGRVQGQVGARLVQLKSGPSEAKAHWITNLVVRPGLQKRGIGTALHRVCVAETGLALALDVTPAAERIFLREGAADLGLVPMYVRALDVGALFDRRTVRARGVLAPIASALLGALDRRAARMLRGDSLTLLEVDRFSAAADAVWSSCAPHYPVLVRRDRAYLNWRFADDPLHRYRLFEVRRGAAPIGIAVLREGEWGGLRAGFVVDWLCGPRDAEPLLAACLDVLRRSRVAAVYCLHANPVSTAMLLRLGFVRRSSGFRFLVCGGAGSDLVRDRRNWFVTLGDSNVDRPRPPPRP